MLLANFNRKEHLRHRAVSLRQHGFLVLIVLNFRIRAYWMLGVICSRTQTFLARSIILPHKQTRKPSYRWQTCATRKHAKNCSNSTYSTLSLTILAYLHSFSCCCIRNLRNSEKFTENSNLWSSRSSKLIDLDVNGKPICDFILVINSNFSRICYRFRDIHA